MSQYNIGIVLDISDATSDTDASIGLDSGIFYWVTGIPGYAGSGYSGDAPASKTWKEGILTDLKRIGQPNRMVDILVNGDYGSLSGFEFEVDNTSLFWNTLESNDYYVINRKIDVYIFIADVSYQVWSGVVKEIQYTETIYKFICKDNWEALHKPLPPVEITKQNFPRVNENAVGKTIPVAIGDVKRAQLFNLFSSNDPVVLCDYQGKQSTVAPLLAYNKASRFISLYTPGMTFDANELKGYYMRNVIGGNGESFRIQSHTATATAGHPSRLYRTEFILEDWFDTDPTSANDLGNNPDADTSTTIWYFEIVTFTASFVVSNDDITEFMTDTNGQRAILNYFDKDLETWVNASDVLNKTSLDDILSELPGMEIVARSLDMDGSIRTLFTIAPDSIQIIEARSIIANYTLSSTSGDEEDLRDNDFDTDYEIVVTVADSDVANILWQYKCDIPPQLVRADFDRVYMIADWNIGTNQDDTDVTGTLLVWLIDVLGRETAVLVNQQLFTATIDNGETEDMYLIPKVHYNDPDTANAQFLDNRQDLEIQSVISNDTVLRGYPKILLQISNTSQKVGAASTITIKVKEIAFVGEKNVNIINQDLFTKIKGEKYSTAETNSVYNTIRLIMETYDGIASADIDYNNMLAQRALWRTGRQIRERKKSNEYLKELAQQAFLIIYPTRDGKRGVKAWRDDSTSVATHDESTILSGGILSWKKSPISKVYNDITVMFDENPGRGDFDKSIFITKTDQASFPGAGVSTGTDTDRSANFTSARVSPPIDQVGSRWRARFSYSTDQSGWAANGIYISFTANTGEQIPFAVIVAVSSDGKSIYTEFDNIFNISKGSYSTATTLESHTTGVPAWSEYAGGFGNNYSLAKSLWEICQASYDRTLAINPLRMGCHWYPDNDEFATGTGGTGNAAMYLMQNLVEWATRQKDIVEYALPINATNIQLELGDPITFNDQKYTNDVNRTGYISKIKIRPAVGEMIIEAVLIPADIEEYGLIIETGDAPDTITERGDQGDDTITEGAQ